MIRNFARFGLILVVFGLSVACTTVVPAPGATPTGAGSATAPAEQALLPDPNASYTVGDTAVLSGGEFGDQADLTVESAVLLGPGSEPGQARYAFLVLITGRDELGFHYNELNFRLIDDQDFQYDVLAGGGMEPILNFGDLTSEQRVRGWLTFEASAETATLRLEYSPVVAIESATFAFLVPG